jgi:Na+/H+ antiporter
VLVCGLAARRVRVAPPVLLLACGALLGFATALRRVHLPPEVVLLLFLPALLYWESITTSLREIRSNLRTIVLLSTGLVIATAAAVAAVAHALGLGWGPAWVLGAAVAPTDATAVSALARMLPRRTVTVLRAESLVNDGTALVIYALAVGITRGQEHFGALHVTGLFLLAYGGGAVAGAVTAWLAVQVRRRLDDPLQGNVAILLTPFTAFLLAEAIHASGVLAVVVCGLIMSQAGPRVGQADTRQQTQAFWSLATFLLNGALFVLVGLELQTAVHGLTSDALTHGLIAVVAVSATVIGARFAWLFTTPYLVRLLDRRPQQRSRRVGARSRVVSGTAGFRGAVSLAAALAVPETVASGAPFPGRDVIIFVTAGVIVVTLVVQGLLLPVAVRWARLSPDSSVQDERHFAEILATEEALAAMPQLADGLGTDSDVSGRLHREYEKHLRPASRGRRRGRRRARVAVRPAVHRAAPGRAGPQARHRAQAA